MRLATESPSGSTWEAIPNVRFSRMREMVLCKASLVILLVFASFSSELRDGFRNDQCLLVLNIGNELNLRQSSDQKLLTELAPNEPRCACKTLLDFIAGPFPLRSAEEYLRMSKVLSYPNPRDRHEFYSRVFDPSEQKLANLLLDLVRDSLGTTVVSGHGISTSIPRELPVKRAANVACH